MVYHYFPRLVERRHVLAGYISGGEQQMTVIGRALMAQPKLMLLDEPSMGWRRCSSRRFRDHHATESGGTHPLLLVEQNVKTCPDVAPYAYVLENGRLVCMTPQTN